MIVRFTIIDQRLLLHLTASSPDPHPTRPPLRHIILAVVCWRLLGITAVGMESGKPGGDICKATNVERVSQSKDVLQQFIVRIGFLGTCCAGSAVYDL